MADLLREHAAVLGGVRDAVIAVDTGRTGDRDEPGGRPGCSGGPSVRGEPLAESGVGPEVVALFEQEPAPRGALRVIGGRVVVATRLHRAA